MRPLLAGLPGGSLRSPVISYSFLGGYFIQYKQKIIIMKTQPRMLAQGDGIYGEGFFGGLEFCKIS